MSSGGQLRERREGDSGLATLELALIMPTLLFLFAGAITVGHMVYVRTELTQQANQIARGCVVARYLDKESCEDLAHSALDKHRGTSWYQTCGGAGRGATGGPLVEVAVPDDDAEVGALEVTISCDYAGIVAPDLLESKDAEVELDLSDADIIVKAMLPFALEVDEPLLLDP